MNPTNACKKLLLNILVPYLEGTNKKENDISQEKRFRDLFKKRKSALIFGTLVFCLIAFGIGKSFSFITGLIACSPFVIVFWSSFGEQLIGIFNFKKNRK